MNKRVLLVEDDPAWQELLTEMLVDMGFTPRRASSYRNAVDALDEGPYTLAVLDVSLVGSEHDNRDGLRLLEQVRTRYPSMPAIILTGYATVDLAVQALTELKANDFLRKEQFDRHRFQEMVQRVLGVGARPRPAAPPPVVAPLQSEVEPIDAHVLVVEDNPGWQGIYDELLSECGTSMSLASSYGEARGLLHRHRFDAAIIDLKLASSTAPEENRDGFLLLRLTQESNVPTIVVSALGDHAVVDRAYEEYHIFSFLDKEGFHRNNFWETLRAAVERQPSPAPLIPSEDNPLTQLTDRQLEVLALLVQGKTNNEIADELIVSVNTVKKHVLAIFSTLDVNTRAAAAAIGVQYGLMPPTEDE